MKIASKNALRFLGVISIPVLIATVMKTVACFTDLNYATGYFRIGILSTVSAYIAAAVCIASISYLFISKSTVPLTKPTGALSFIPSGMASAAQIRRIPPKILSGCPGRRKRRHARCGLHSGARYSLRLFGALLLLCGILREARKHDEGCLSDCCRRFLCSLCGVPLFRFHNTP